VGELADQFLESRMDRLDGGELRPNTMRDYLRVVDSIVLGLGRNRRAADLGPADFADLRARAAKRSGPATVGKLVTVVRMLFRFAHDRELVAELPRYGDGFRKPDMLARRRAKRARAQRSDFTAEEIRRLWVGAVEVGDQVMAAMLLLAINGGLGQTDLAQLPISALRLDAPGMGIPHIDFPRPKTEVDRTITLWPETVAALRAALEQRPTPRDGIGTGKSGPVFITGGGWPYVRENVSRVGGAVDAVSRVDAVALAFRRLRQRVHLPADAPGFYGLRHSFITAADSAGDPHAIHRIRGHSLPGMSSVYVERITMDRLRRVTDHVRAWLLDGWSCPWPRGA
jgi:integrase